MKVSKREKILLCALLIIGTLVLYYQFIFSPKLEEVKQLKAKNIECDDRIEKLKTKAEEDKKNKVVKKNLQGKILTISQEIFPLLQGDDVIFILDNIFDEIDIGASGFSMSQVTAETFQPMVKDEKTDKAIEKSPIELSADKYLEIQEKIDKKNSEDHSNKENKDSENDVDNKDKGSQEENDEKTSIKKLEVSQQVDVPKVDISLNYNTTYDSLRKFINKLENYPRKFTLNNLSISSSDETNVSGSMNIQMYCIPVFQEEYYSFFEKDLSGEKGKYNPFVFNRIDKKEIIVSEKIEKADFEMLLKPTSSDFPSVILGKVEGSMSSKLMKDKNDTVDVSVFFKEDNKKYYYRYEVGDFIYPQNGFEEFKPVDGEKIKISILSTVRNSHKDESGINLKVENKTLIPVQLDISCDDKERPRVNITEITGKVNLN